MKNQTLLEQVDCPLCGEKNNTPKFYEENVVEKKKIILGINQCSSCALCYVSPRLNAQGLSLLYNSSYLEETVSGRYNTDESVSRAEYAQFVQYLSDKTSHGACVLDVGCGVGLLLDALHAKREDLRLKGVEFSSFAAEKALAKGYEVRVGDFSNKNLVDAGSADAVVLLYVLEHVPNPVDFLKAAHFSLKDDGYLFLAVPNYRYLRIVKTGLISRVIFRKPSNIHAAEHLFNFTPKTITSTLKQTGFQVRYIGQSKPLNIGTPLFRLVKLAGSGIAHILGMFGYYIGGIHVIAQKSQDQIT